MAQETSSSGAEMGRVRVMKPMLAPKREPRMPLTLCCGLRSKQRTDESHRCNLRRQGFDCDGASVAGNRAASLRVLYHSDRSRIACDDRALEAFGVFARSVIGSRAWTDVDRKYCEKQNASELARSILHSRSQNRTFPSLLCCESASHLLRWNPSR